MREMFGRKAVSKNELNEKYQSALQFAQNFEPKPETDYGWVIAYADAEYRRLESIGKELDTKADGFIRYSVLVVSALSLLSAYDSTSLNIEFAKLHVFPGGDIDDRWNSFTLRGRSYRRCRRSQWQRKIHSPMQRRMRL